MSIIAVDPGKITGYACTRTSALDCEMTAGQLPYFEFLEWMEAAVYTYAPWGLEVVCEKFQITQATVPRAADAHWAMGTIGCIEYWCRKWDVPLTMQTPSEAKKFLTDDKLRRLGWYESTPGGHRNDACRHLALRLVRAGQIPLSAVAPEPPA